MTAAVSACLIVKDEAENLKRTIPSYRPHVAEICVYDTGSTDGTLELLESLASQPGPPIRVERGEWTGNYAEARSASLEMASHHWALCLDADEELIGGENLARSVARADEHGVSMVAAMWDFADDPETGEPLCQLHGRGFIVNRNRGAFEGMVHETWRPHGGGDWPLNPSVWICAEGIMLHHLRRQLTSERYLPLLERAASDPSGTKTPRALFYYGAELYRLGRLEEARTALRSYLADRWDACEGTPNRWRLMALQLLQQVLVHCPHTWTRAGFPLMQWTSASLNEYVQQIPWRYTESGSPEEPPTRSMAVRPADGWLPYDQPLFGNL